DPHRVARQPVGGAQRPEPPVVAEAHATLVRSYPELPAPVAIQGPDEGAGEPVVRTEGLEARPVVAVQPSPVGPDPQASIGVLDERMDVVVLQLAPVERGEPHAVEASQ